jgi:hypothetical protein
MTFTKKHNPGCGCCECEGDPIRLQYRIPDGETEYFRTQYNGYAVSGFDNFESYNSTWDEISGSWTKRYYQTINDKRDDTPDRSHGLMTEDDDALLIYKPLDQNQQRSVVTVALPWINDEFPDYSQYSSKSDCEIKVVSAYQDANNYLYAKIRFKRRDGLPMWYGSFSEELRRGSDKICEIEFYERSAGTDTKIGDTRYWYQTEGALGRATGSGGGVSSARRYPTPIVIEWCYVPETYDNDGKMTVSIYSNLYGRQYRNKNLPNNLFDFKDEHGFWWGPNRANEQQGHWIFSEEMNSTGTQVGFGTGTIHEAPTDDEVTNKRNVSYFNYFNKGVVFESFGNYLHNKENGACPQCARGCVPHTTGTDFDDANYPYLARELELEYRLRGQYEKLPSTNDDLNLTLYGGIHGTLKYAEVKANNADTKWITYSEVRQTKDHNHFLWFYLDGEEDSTFEISLVFDYLDDDNYHRLHFSGTLTAPGEGGFGRRPDLQTTATLQLYKMTGGSEATVGDEATVTLNHQWIYLSVCTLSNQLQFGIGEFDAMSAGWDYWANTNGILETEMRNTSYHGGVRQGFMTHTTSDDDVIQAPQLSVFERRKNCSPCNETVCENCGNAPSFYKIVIEWGRMQYSYNEWGIRTGTWRTDRRDGDDPNNCRNLDGTYIATRTADCVYELEHDKFKFWLKLTKNNRLNSLDADVQMWIEQDGVFLPLLNQSGVAGRKTINEHWLAQDCSLPHDFTMYSGTGAGWWGMHEIKCHSFSWWEFNEWFYRVRVVRE